MNNLKNNKNQKQSELKQQPKSQPKQPLQTNQKQYSGSNAQKSERFNNEKTLHDDAKIDRDSRDSFPASDSPSYR